VTILGAVAYGALFVVQQINDGVQNTKARYVDGLSRMNHNSRAIYLVSKPKASIYLPRVCPSRHKNALIGSIMSMRHNGVLGPDLAFDLSDSVARGFVKAMGASSFGKADDPSSPGSSPTAVHRAPSSSSTKSSGSADYEKKKRGFFSRSVSSPKEKT
jgi:hypothetical protein